MRLGLMMVMEGAYCARRTEEVEAEEVQEGLLGCQLLWHKTGRATTVGSTYHLNNLGEHHERRSTCVLNAPVVYELPNAHLVDVMAGDEEDNGDVVVVDLL